MFIKIKDVSKETCSVGSLLYEYNSEKAKTSPDEATGNLEEEE